MSRTKVNRFTFDTHSVVLFSALVLSGSVTAHPSPAQRLTGATATTQSATPHPAPRAASQTLVATSPARTARRAAD